MNDALPLTLPPHISHALALFLRESGSDADAIDVASAAIEEWIERAEAEAQREAQRGPQSHTRAHHRPAGNCGQIAHGFQWKQMFLPDGTRLRMWFNGSFHYGEVDGDELLYLGRPVSPARMVNDVTGSTRNAWRDLWLLLPGESTWKLASYRRRQAQLAQQAVDALRTRAASASADASTSTGTGTNSPAPCAAGTQTTGGGSATPLHRAAAQAPLFQPVPPQTETAAIHRLATILELALAARAPLYRRRTDALDEAFDGD